MNSHKPTKKNLIVSFKNLPEELKELFKELYPEGYKQYVKKIVKPNGEPLFVVPLETDDTMYMVKFEMKIDTALGDELEKDLFDDDEEKDESGEFAPLTEAIDKEESGNSHTERVVRHGALEEQMLEAQNEAQSEFSIDDVDSDEFADDERDPLDEDEEDDDEFAESDEPSDADIDVEPTAEEIAEMEKMYIDTPGLIGEDTKPKRGRKPAAPKAVKAPKAPKVTKVAKAPKTPKKK